MLKLSSVLLTLLVLTVGQKTRYDDYKVFRVIPRNQEQNNFLHSISDEANGVNIYLF